MPQKTPLHCSEFSCQMKFTSASWQLKDIKLHHPEHLEVAPWMNLTIRSAPRLVEPAHCQQFHNINYSVEDLDAFPQLEQVQYIADTDSQRMPPPLHRTETYPPSGSRLSDCFATPWESDAMRCLGTNLGMNPYFSLATHEQYKYIQYWPKKTGVKRYYDNVLKEEITTLYFPSINTGYGIQKVVASIPADQALGAWELHTLEHMRWNHSHQHPIK